jgi:hypothetical protein
MIGRKAGVRLPSVSPFCCLDLFNFKNEEAYSQSVPSNKFEQWPPATDSDFCLSRGTKVKRLALAEKFKL